MKFDKVAAVVFLFKYLIVGIVKHIVTTIPVYLHAKLALISTVFPLSQPLLRDTLVFVSNLSTIFGAISVGSCGRKIWAVLELCVCGKCTTKMYLHTKFTSFGTVFPLSQPMLRDTLAFVSNLSTILGAIFVGSCDIVMWAVHELCVCDKSLASLLGYTRSVNRVRMPGRYSSYCNNELEGRCLVWEQFCCCSQPALSTVRKVILISLHGSSSGRALLW